MVNHSLSPGFPPRSTVAKAIHEYFSDPATSLDVIPVAVNGTAFQQRVWHSLTRIPVGQTRSYAELARMLCTSPRAIGNACRANPVPVVVPCHRVVGIKGMGGYAGQSSGLLLDFKAFLLRHESRMGDG